MIPLRVVTAAALLAVFSLRGVAQMETTPVFPEILPAAPLTVSGTLYEPLPGGGVVFEAAPGLKRDVVRSEQAVSFGSLEVLHAVIPGQQIDHWRHATALAHRTLSLLPEWPELFRYVIEYADGVEVAVPVRFGESIEARSRVQTVAPMLWARDGHVVAVDGRQDESRVWYRMRVPNPRPAVPAQAVRAERDPTVPGDGGVVAVVAVRFSPEPAADRLLVVARPPLGKDGNAGTFDAPLASVGAAAAQARPGDFILVRGGHHALTRPVIFNFEGKEGRWLTFSSFPGETAILDGTGVATDPTVAPHGPNRDPVLQRHQHDTGLVHAMGDPSYLRIQGLRIQNSKRAGISVYGTTEAGDSGRVGWASTRKVEVAFNTTYRTFSMGIITQVLDDLAVIGNRVIRPHSISMVTNPETGEVESHDHLPQEGIDLSRNRRFEVAFNSVGGGGKEAIDAISVEDGSIHHNYVHSSLNGIYIDSWSVPIRRVQVYRNFIHNAFAGIPLATEGSSDLVDFKIHNNIVIDSKSEGISVSEATYKAEPSQVSGHRVFNNTVVGSGRHASAIGWQGVGIGVAGFRENPKFRDVEVVDNIVFRTQGRPLRNLYFDDPSRAILFSHNLVEPRGDSTPETVRSRSRSGWNEAESVLGEAPVAGDPLFQDPSRGDFRLRPGSPAAGAGRSGGDLGALPVGARWNPGLDFAGAVTAYYHGSVIWRPIDIPRSLFTMHRTHHPRPSWFQRNRYGVDFQNLPEGEQSFAGITFHVAEASNHSTPNILVVRGFSAEVEAESILGIPVGRAADRLAFLHNYHLANGRAVKRGDVLFSYRVRYADGQQVDIPVRHGIEVEDWLGGEEAVRDLPGAKLAWSQKVQKRRGGQAIRLYAMVWENARPQEPIVAIDILNAQPYETGAPAVFALSTGNL